METKKIANGSSRTSFVRNSHGILIKKCCASCRHHCDKGDTFLRHCRIDGHNHRIDYLCSYDKWEMNPALDNAGKGDGRVKNPQYIRFMLDYGRGRSDEYEQMYGSKYLTKK